MNIYIYYTVKLPGGAQDLFIRALNALDKDPRNSINVICQDGSYIESRLKELGAQIKFYNHSDDLSHLGDGVLISALSEILLIKQLKLNSEMKILLWSLSPYNTCVFFHSKSMIARRYPILFRNLICKTIEKNRHEKLIKFHSVCSEKQGIIYQDMANVDFIKSFNAKANNEAIVPILFEPTEKPNIKKLNKNMQFSFGWLGRLDPDKSIELKKLLISLSKFALKNKINIDFHIVGHGKKLSYFETKKFRGINSKVMGSIYGDDLKEYMLKNFQIGFAMGTSVIDIASLGIPAIIVDPNAAIFGSSIRWFHDGSHGDVGAISGIYPKKKMNNKDIFREMMEVSSNEDKYNKKSDLAFQKSREFNINNNINILYKALRQTRYTVFDLQKVDI